MILIWQICILKPTHGFNMATHVWIFCLRISVKNNQSPIELVFGIECYKLHITIEIHHFRGTSNTTQSRVALTKENKIPEITGLIKGRTFIRYSYNMHISIK